MYPCQTMEDVLTKVWAQIKLEQEDANRPYVPNQNDRREPRRERQFERRIPDYRAKPYPLDKSRGPLGNPTHRPIQQRTMEFRAPQPEECVVVMKNLSDKIRWPGKLRTPPVKEKL